MKLFSPSQSKTAFNSKQSQDIVQVAYLTSTLDNLQKRINEENTNFTKSMAEQREVYGNEKTKLQDEVKNLENTLVQMRQERADLMIPVNTLREQAETVLLEAQKRSETLADTQIEVDSTLEHLTAKMSELLEREQVVAEKEQKVAREVVGLEKEKEGISASHARLNEMLATFNEQVVHRTKELDERESAMLIKVKMNQEYLDAKEKDYISREHILADRFSMLERTIKGLNK